jgi:hypothetical protein
VCRVVPHFFVVNKSYVITWPIVSLTSIEKVHPFFSVLKTHAGKDFQLAGRHWNKFQ